MHTLPGGTFNKRIRIAYSHENEAETIVVCPYCGKLVTYGETATINGITYCPYCRDKCIKEVVFDQEFNFKEYRNKDYQPYGISIAEALKLEGVKK